MTEKTEPNLVSVSLSNEVTINGVKYIVGGHSVHPDIAADLVRMDKAAIQYQLGLNKNVAVNGNGGSISAA